MRWLIVEDALRDRKGHWFEYLGTFARELRALDDDVTILADKAAEQFLIEQLHVQPILPASIWHRMGDGAGALRRYSRVPLHAWQTYCAVKNYLRNGDSAERRQFGKNKKGGFLPKAATTVLREPYDIFFVPTVLVHHLLGWVWLVKRVLKKSSARVLLFFPNTPVQLDLKTSEPSWQPAPTAKLFHRLIRFLQDEVKQGRVILGAETYPMREALTQLTGVPFTYFPHPVAADINAEKLKTENQKEEDKAESRKQKAECGNQTSNAGISEFPISDVPPSTLNAQRSTEITFGFYGSARHEKGSDILVAAVDEFCRRYPDSSVKFVLQSVDGDAKLWERLKGNSKIQLIPHYFADGQYARQLAQTDALLLPYRRSSYGLRVSRVVIEAMVHGIPVVTTRGTTLEDQAGEFGAMVLCEDENVDSLVQAIREMEENFTTLQRKAEPKTIPARQHFSLLKFRALLKNG
jgi:glycosyltransferase involved in cell wall biosynthesis